LGESQFKGSPSKNARPTLKKITEEKRAGVWVMWQRVRGKARSSNPSTTNYIYKFFLP
jgi:hypothetical protein